MDALQHWGRIIAVALSLASPSVSSAIWTCHGPNGTSWQQPYPPCETPPPDAVQRPQRGAPDISKLQSKPATRTIVPAEYGRSNAAPVSPTYATVLAELESRHPAINPDSAAFDPVILQRVAAAMRQKASGGMDQITALRAATSEVLEPPPSTSAAPLRADQPKGRPDNRWNDFAGGAVGAFGVLVGLWLLMKVIGILLRSAGWVAGKAVDVVEKTSAHDIARAAGGVAGVAQRKTSGLVEAFKEGKREKS